MSANKPFTRSWQSSKVPSIATLWTLGASTVVICRRCTSRHPAGRMEHDDRQALPADAGVDRGGARVARRGDDDRAPVVPARQLGVHQSAHELQRDVLERERRAVPQLEHVHVVARGRTSGHDVRMVERRRRPRSTRSCEVGEVVDERPTSPTSPTSRRWSGQRRCARRQRLGDVQAAVARQALEQHVGEPEHRAPRLWWRRTSRSMTRSTVPTRSTASSSRRSRSVACTSASRATWVMKMRRASSPRPSCSIARIDTPCSPNTPATAASTPGRSSTSRFR